MIKPLRSFFFRQPLVARLDSLNKKAIFGQNQKLLYFFLLGLGEMATFGQNQKLLFFFLLGLGKTVGNSLPSNDIPPRLDVVRAHILVLQVVSVLPNIEAEQRHLRSVGRHRILNELILLSVNRHKNNHMKQAQKIIKKSLTII